MKVYFKIKDWRGVKFPTLNLKFHNNCENLSYLRNHKNEYDKMEKQLRTFYQENSGYYFETSNIVLNMQRVPMIGEKIKFDGKLIFGELYGKDINVFKTNIFPKKIGEKPMQWRERVLELINTYGDDWYKYSINVKTNFEHLITDFVDAMNLCFKVVDVETHLIEEESHLTYTNELENSNQEVIKLTLEVFEGE
jgi:hypothetical protein